LEWFNQGPQTTVEEEDSRLTVVGTIFHPEDLYSHLLSIKDPETGGYIWQAERKSAIVNEEKELTLWPRRWSWERLMREKAGIGTIDFMKRFCNVAVDPDAQVFREEYIKGDYIGNVKYPGCLDYDHIVGRVPDPNWPVYAGFDPAIGTYRGHSYCAHVTIAVGNCDKHEKCLWVIDVMRDQYTLPQQVEIIINQNERYNIFVTMIEKNGYQQGLIDEITRRNRETGYPIKAEPHFTSAQTKPDPELGIPSMSTYFENGLVHIPHGNPESMRKMRTFIDELIQYPAGTTTDTVMAFWFAYRKAREGLNSMRPANRLYQGAQKEWWKQTIGPRRVLYNPYYIRD
jgi:predicted phage terminase large subunit-like protein